MIDVEKLKQEIEVEINKLIDEKHPEPYLEGWAEGATFTLVLMATALLNEALNNGEEIE